MAQSTPPIRLLPKKRRDLWAWYIFAVVFVILLVSGGLGRGDEDLASTLRWAVPILLAIGFGGWIAWTVRRARRFGAENDAALAMLHAGETEAARERFEALVKRWRRPRNWNHLALFNLAWTELIAGEFALAREHIAQIEAERDPRATGGIVAMLPSRLAYVHALLGELDDARAWLDASRERAAAETTNRGVIEAWELATEAVVACRANDAPRAKSLLAERWLQLDKSLTGDALRPLRLVRAFAVHAASNGAEESTVEALLQPVREHPRSEAQHLGAHWPAMRAFLAERGLA
ncbi:MAG: hypothetical protein HZA53_12355 [Planctomycetes bacterium]|nr:hypothetical protein [Planctomycetota bacterium]